MSDAPKTVEEAFGHRDDCNVWVENAKGFRLDRTRACTCQGEEPVRCAWVMDRGYHKGCRCGNDGKYVYKMKPYCAVHLGLAQDQARLAKQPKSGR